MQLSARIFWGPFIISLCFISCSGEKDFVRVDGTQFTIGDKPYFFLGTNFWYGLNLGIDGKQGNRERLIRELDRLQSLGINNLRIMGGSEGPDTEPYRMLPSLQTGPGVYNEDVAKGLDFLLSEMSERNMYAVVCLNNFWNWSGGLGQYLVWTHSATSIPHPPPHPGGDWGVYQEFAAKFYSDSKAVELFNDHIKYMINRKNSITGTLYKDDPTIMAWELANEPRGVNNKRKYQEWLNSTCGLIKKLDKNHLVTLGSEGRTSSDFAGVDPEGDHSGGSVDYMTIHIWVQNWNIYDPAKPDSTLPSSIAYALDYLDDHEAMARKLNKPLVLEEFGISRDGNSHDPKSGTAIRDKYYSAIFEAIYKKMQQENSVVAGCNFWAWAGEGRPTVPGGLWKVNQDFIGDPPHEPQGWYSVYDTDTTTNAIIGRFCQSINALGKKD
jgi:mannan endo-1,4-beta-mannosidase